MVQWSGEPGPGVMSWDEFMAVGREVSDDLLQQRLSLAAVNQCCTIIYTSGTTGPPKGVMLSQDQVTWGAEQYKKVFGILDGVEVTLSYLPLSHLAAQIGDMYNSISSGVTLYFAPADALKGSLGKVLLEARPTQFFAVPRVWEKIYEKMQEVGANASYFTKTVAAWAKYHGLNYYNAMKEGRELSTLELLKYNLAKTLVLSKVRNAIGLDRAHNLASGAAPIDSEILDYFFSLDIPIMEGYGMSESLSLCSMSSIKPGHFKTGAVGKVLSLTEVKLVDAGEYREGEGEICMRGRNVCMGYLLSPDKTDEAVSSFFNSSKDICNLNFFLFL
ncbi:UNVERIFIED_CONTAM: hypothetical protein GTU68_005263 [Idotea baltica]|nr:hypothetical protein [Idotea baltica]